MAKKNDKETENIENVEVAKPKVVLPKKEYVIKRVHTIGDKTYAVGDKIKLTKQGYEYLKSKKIV